MTILEQELRMRCIEQAVTIGGRLQTRDTKEIIAIAKELCEYAVIGSSPTGSTTEGVSHKKPKPSGRGLTKGATVKSG